MQIKFVLNPVAGRGNSLKILPRVKERLEQEGVQYEILKTKYPGNGAELARRLEKSGDIIAAIGGDGTVREVINGVRSPETPIGIIPAGMGNDLARSLGIPSEASKATQNLLNLNTSRVDLGSERGKLFNVMGVGFPAEVVGTINRYKNGFIKGSVIYLLGLLHSLTKLETYDLRLETDGEIRDLQANAVFVANSKFTGGGIKLIPHAGLTDGLLDVAVISEAGRTELVLALKRAYQGRHVDHPKIEFMRAKSIRIEAKSNLPKMFDGELEGVTPAELEIAPRARTIIVPPRTEEDIIKRESHRIYR
ncbi:diacylglycerol kinase family lipid kinase [Candidatus Bipolaricaulota bacterium]|nr:diacylglycerol kinase family lipid kinase [Candidatus Bipolaricaulota bacterium]MBS3814272.1 diacylglycerol kinase family lipid kinase [Candidatus Bipolaricaulota bacterium]MBS3825299.1 diacylglycerol kinase family lipid kinase [Candidatus Bipolaricaulota bacterium]